MKLPRNGPLFDPDELPQTMRSCYVCGYPMPSQLPSDALEVAERLEPMEQWARNEYDDMTEADTLARAIAILRGEV